MSEEISKKVINIFSKHIKNKPVDTKEKVKTFAGFSYVRMDKDVNGYPFKEAKLLDEYEKLNTLQSSLVSQQTEAQTLISSKEAQIAEIQDQITDNANLLADLKAKAEEAKRLQKKNAKNQFDFNDFLSQIAQIKKMGNLKELASMIPGVGKAIKDIDIDDNAFKSIEAIIYSMTPAERSNPELLNGSRRTRIAKGSGTTIQEVNRLLKQFDQTRKMMKMVTSSKMGKKDIIKIDALIDIDMNVLGYVDPEVTVNIIRDGVLAEKKSPELPEKLTNVIKCCNPRCITTTEQELPHVFHLIDRKNRVYRCIYCDSRGKFTF